MKIGVKEASSRAKATSPQALSTLSELSIGFLCDLNWPTPGQTPHQMPNRCMAQSLPNLQPLQPTPTEEQPPSAPNEKSTIHSTHLAQTSPRPRRPRRHLYLPLTVMAQSVAAVNELHHASFKHARPVRLSGAKSSPNHTLSPMVALPTSPACLRYLSLFSSVAFNMAASILGRPSALPISGSLSATFL